MAIEGRTHVLGGLAAGVAAASIVPHAGVPVLLVSAALAGPLADVDHPASMYGRFIPLPGVVLGRDGLKSWQRSLGFHDGHGGRVGREILPKVILWHRNETHSLGAVAITTILAACLTFFLARPDVPPVALGVFVGYLSHLALDLINISPIMLWWPFSRKTAHLRFPRIRVGSPWESIVAVVLAIAVAATVAGMLGITA